MHALRAEPAIESWTVRGRSTACRGRSRRQKPDVVVLGCNDDPPLAGRAARAEPRLKVLAVAEEGQDPWLYGLTRSAPVSAALSPSRSCDAIREATARPPRASGGGAVEPSRSREEIPCL